MNFVSLSARTVYSQRVHASIRPAKLLATRVISLLRNHPILALPLVVADLLSFLANHLQHALHQPLFNLLLAERHSVLGGSRAPFILTPQNATKATLLSAPLILSSYFVTVCLYTSALLVVSALIEAFHNDNPIDVLITIKHVLSRTSRIFSLSASLMGLLSIPLFIGFLMLWLVPNRWLLMGDDAVSVVYLIVNIPIMLIAVRLMMKSLLPQDANPTQYMLHLARIAGLAMITAQLLLNMLIRHAPAVVFQQTSVPGFLIREAIVSLIVAAPYIPFFIALGLLANGESEVSEATEEQSYFAAPEAAPDPAGSNTEC